jgi:hypothetical protein
MNTAAHLFAAAAGLFVMRWRMKTETKKFDLDWWLFMIFQAANVIAQTVAVWVQ